tara:strand:- start:98 stop:211 length:114 start_codon:yes stop_codon:yes gene_type:complete
MEKYTKTTRISHTNVKFGQNIERILGIATIEIYTTIE